MTARASTPPAETSIILAPRNSGEAQSKGDPEGSVNGPDESASPRHQGGELLAKGKVLGQEMAAGTEGRDEHPHRYRYKSEHGEERLPCTLRNVNETGWDEVLANDSLLRNVTESRWYEVLANDKR